MSQVFDIEQLMNSLGGDGELAGELLEAFMEDSPERRESLREALQAGDAQQAAKLAHSLKGMCGVVRCNGLTNLALSMENTAKDGDLDKVREQFVDFDRIMDEAHAEIQAYLDAR